METFQPSNGGSYELHARHLSDRVELQLSDVTNARYSTGDLDEGIRQALNAYTEHLPLHAVGTVELAAAGREIDVSSLTYRTIDRVWWNYDEDAPDHPPHWRNFDVWPGDLLFISDPEEPAGGDVVRIFYTADHTLEDLD